MQKAYSRSKVEYATWQMGDWHGGNDRAHNLFDTFSLRKISLSMQNVGRNSNWTQGKMMSSVSKAGMKQTQGGAGSYASNTSPKKCRNNGNSRRRPSIVNSVFLNQLTCAV
mmetsp:Transcript_46464/g.74717  ORF Transcript_46464/g.74717 Transcript_46464/m.74717 type:complete len:111 (+) Transcript_46464:869-1201(+)